ncbi:MAG: Nudix family hydrolase [Burkholderiales bacterium]|nr:Nudix family hydrolase [Burkholderiales bacterium]
MPVSTETKITDVAVAVITQPDGSFLLARRPEGKPYAGYWEFPGGKVEPNERVADALAREVKEELGIDVTCAYPWVTQVFTYPHAKVKLHFYRVTAWQGVPHPHEGQVFSWERAELVRVEPVLPANSPILRGLSLPPVMGVSQAVELGIEPFLAKLDAALKRGLCLIQLREKQLPENELVILARRVAEVAHAYGARVMLNGDPNLVAQTGVDGVHLSTQQLMRANQRPDVAWCGASCHTRPEMDHAAQLQLDYVVLGTVLPTASHPGEQTLGWENVAALAQDYPLPIYTIGGMRAEDLETAWQHGAHGIAMLRGAW